MSIVQSNFSVLLAGAYHFILHVITSFTSAQYLPAEQKERINGIFTCFQLDL